MNGDRVDAMDRQQQRWMECDAIDCCGFVNLCFWFVLHDGCKLTTPNPSALILGVKFCNQETGTNLHTQERNKRFSTFQLLNAISPFCHVLFGAICHVLLFVMFSLAPYLSLPELVLVRMYTFLVTMFGDPSAYPTDPKNMA